MPRTRCIPQGQELHHDGPDTAGCRRHCHGLARLGIDGADRRIGGTPDDVERSGHFPAELRWLVDQLGHRNSDVSGVARAPPGEPQHGVLDGEVVDTVADVDNDARQVAPLAGWKSCRKSGLQRTGSDC